MTNRIEAKENILCENSTRLFSMSTSTSENKDILREEYVIQNLYLNRPCRRLDVYVSMTTHE